MNLIYCRYHSFHNVNNHERQYDQPKTKKNEKIKTNKNNIGIKYQTLSITVNEKLTCEASSGKV